MRYRRVYIEALTAIAPATEVTTASIERMLERLYRRLGVPSGTVERLTGIRARRFWDEGVLPSEAAATAARGLLEGVEHALPPLGALVSTSVCKDYLEPSVAALVHGKLGLPSGCLNFDVGNACLGFLTGLVTVANQIELGAAEAGLVVAGEGSRTVTRSTVQRLMKPGVPFETLRDNFATLTLGSAASAALLVHERHARAGHQLLGGTMLAATEHSRLCIGTETEMRTDAATLLREGVRLAKATWLQAQRELELGVEDVSEFALHQVGKANHEALISALGLPDARALRLYPDYGNVGAAGVPLTLAEAVRAGRVRTGDRAMLMGIGSGLNCAMLGVRW